MKQLTRVQACTAGIAAAVLAAGTIGVGAASADTEPAAAGLAAPAGLTPDDSGTALPHAVRKTVKLDWAPVAGATGYRIEVGQDVTWSDDPTYAVTVVSSEATLPVWLPHATYVWRVAALKGSAVGHWSSETGRPQNDAEFTRGWRDAPVPTAVTVPFNGRPTYSWSPVPSAYGYQLQVSTRADFARTGTPTPDTSPSPTAQTQPATGVDTCFTTRTRITPNTQRVEAAGDDVGACYFGAPTPGSTLYWRVRALDAFTGTAVDVNTTPASTGGISYQPPATTTTETDVTSDCPSTPGPSASPSATPTATPTATPSAGPTTGCEPAEPVERSNWSSTSSYVYTQFALAGTFDPSALVPTNSVGPDPDGLCTVTVAAGVSAEKATCRDVPTVSWSAAPGALRYRIYFALDDEYTNIQEISETSALQWTPSDSWRENSPSLAYYYAVQACDDTRCGAVTSTPASFRKVTPRPTVGARPGNAGEFTLSWQSYADTLQAATGRNETQDARWYHVQVATTDHPLYDALVDDALVDQTTYMSPTKNYGDGSFIWRVQPVDSAGNKLPWSLSQGFTRDSTPPRAISVAPSNRVGVKQALTVVFSEPVTGISSSSLGLSPAVPLTVTVVDSKTAILTPTRAYAPGSGLRVLVGSAVRDLAGNIAVAAGPVLTVTLFVDDNSAALSYSAGWRRLQSSNAVGGSFTSSSPTPTTQTSVTMPFSGAGVTVGGCLSPTSGYADVYVDGVRKVRANGYRSYTGCGVKLASIAGLARGSHTLRIVGIGAHGAGSKGNSVAVDSFTVAP